MQEWTRRSQLLLGQDGLEKLQKSHIMIFGLGGVGSYAAEAVARSGVGEMTIVDADTISISNINRQLPALCSTVGKSKVSVVAQRLLDINPQLKLHAVCQFHLPQSPVEIPKDAAFVLDAIDTVSAKLDIIGSCQARRIPIISCMGMGNRLDPTQIRIGDIYATSDCPLCRVMRRELRKREVPSLTCVYSLEKALTPEADEEKSSGHPAPGSIAYVPSVAGLYMAYWAVNQIVSSMAKSADL